MVKKHIVLFLFIPLLLTGCTRRNFNVSWDNAYDAGISSDISSTLRWEPPDRLIITYTNNTDLLLGYGLGHDLQKYSGEHWVSVPNIVEPYVNQPLFNLQPNASFDRVVYLSHYGNLRRGSYRVVMNFTEDRFDETTGILAADRLEFEVFAEFEITR